MLSVPFYIVDVFANQKYGGNQLAVFIDLDDQISDDLMQKMASEINFAETTFIKSNQNDSRFDVRIFTPEHEIPFAGHPSLGTAYIIAKYLLPTVPQNLTLALRHGDIAITIAMPENLDNSILFMQQLQPEFRERFDHQVVASELQLDFADLDMALPIQEVSTGLPYILIPLNNLAAIESLYFDYATLQQFLFKRQKYRTNSITGHSTSLFFFTAQTQETDNHYHARMILLENGRVSEDAATGSANGCLLAYLLQYQSSTINATVEQGFELNRHSYIFLDGKFEEGQYQINVGGSVKMVSVGEWFV
jgi:trans-2,3-dihydro-3-hydroxyanthranilate isomerase